MLRDLPIDMIDQRADARGVDDATVVGLVDSIAAVGLINPVRVRASGDRWELIAGAHRLSACRRLGLAEIRCVVVADDDLHAELAMIDENLCRAELSPSDRAKQTARRKAIYEELHPETKQGASQAAGMNAALGRGRQIGDDVDRFTAETASVTGRSERAVQRDAERGEKVIDEVLDMIRGTALDTGTYLDKIKRLPPNEQVTAAQRDLALLRQRERAAGDRQRERTRTSKIDADVKARAAKEVAEVIAEYVPGEWWDSVKSNLYAAGAANIANELTNITGQSIMDRRYGS